MTRSDSAKNAAVSAVMAAVLIAGKFALHFVYNVEVVTPLVIIFTCVFGFKRTLFAVLVFCVADNFIYTFSYLVTMQYFFHWPFLCAASYMLNKFFRGNFFAFALLAAFFALLFWVETPAIESLLGFTKFFPRLYAGFLFMLPMFFGGFAFTLIAFKPLSRALESVKNKIFT